MAQSQSSLSSARPPMYSSPAMANSSIHPGTFAPGTKVQVGSHRVIVDKYLSEGGFAHVYAVRIPRSSGRSESAVLKRVAVPDKDALASMRTEVDTMKRLKGHKHIVTYIDSHASQLKDGGYEVFLLMEYCNGGGLIDLMNTRLKNRLTEPEILKIFAHTAEGVACMHYLKPPLLHRDLKVENVLISNTPSSELYKLCDFGSSAPPRPAVTSAAEGRLIEEDVQKHTTLQYRSPEMIDVYQKRPIDEKSDIWALGVLLYKLCYYTTPFEEQGQMAILTASFKYPGYPKFSDRLKKFIASMLTLDPRSRPNIYEVLCEVCAMRGKDVPIKDIYATRSHSEARSNQQLPDSALSAKSPPQIGVFHAAPDQVMQELPEVTPMRRGRPTSSPQPSKQKTIWPTANKKDKDPFAALDSPSFATRSNAVDELSSRFPPAEQFSLLQNKDSTFQFGASSDKSTTLKDRVTNALADEVFATTSVAATKDSLQSPIPAVAAKPATLRNDRHPGPSKIESSPSGVPSGANSMPQKPEMVSTGTMTSQNPSPKASKVPIVNKRPIWRVPPPKLGSPGLEISPDVKSEVTDPVPSLIHHQQSEARDLLRSPVSSRPSLEGMRTSQLKPPHTIHRSRSADESSLSPTKSEYTSTDSFTVDSRQDNARRKETTSEEHDNAESTRDADDGYIPSNVDFLRAMEEEESSKSHDRRSSPINRFKRTSLQSVPKQMFAGRLGHAFRRFEAGDGGDRASSPDPLADDANINTSRNARGGVDDLNLEDDAIDETEKLSPEMRRELERRRLYMEEKRVAEAGAAYRQQMMDGGGRAPIVNRASSIQNRVASLLDESGRVSPVKTAEGYGKYTVSGRLGPASDAHATRTASRAHTKPAVKPNTTAAASLPSGIKALNLQRAAPKPVAPPKPKAFRTGGLADANAKSTNPSNDATDVSSGDVDSDFSKRYPSLSLETVEMAIERPQKLPSRSMDTRVRDV